MILILKEVYHEGHSIVTWHLSEFPSTCQARTGWDLEENYDPAKDPANSSYSHKMLVWNQRDRCVPRPKLPYECYIFGKRTIKSEVDIRYGSTTCSNSLCRPFCTYISVKADPQLAGNVPVIPQLSKVNLLSTVRCTMVLGRVLRNKFSWSFKSAICIVDERTESATWEKDFEHNQYNICTLRKWRT